MARELLRLLGAHADIGQGLLELSAPRVKVHGPRELGSLEGFNSAGLLGCRTEGIENVCGDVRVCPTMGNECRLQVSPHSLRVVDTPLGVGGARIGHG